MEDDVAASSQVVPRQAAEFYRGSAGKPQTSGTAAESAETNVRRHELPNIHGHKNRRYQSFSSGLNLKQPSFGRDDSSTHLVPSRPTEPRQTRLSTGSEKDSRSLGSKKKYSSWERLADES